MSRVVVTGATGFIGQHVCKELLQSGWNVTALVRATSDHSALSGLDVDFEVIDREKLTSLLADSQADAVVHCAAAYGRNSDGLEELFDVNVLLPFRLMQAAICNEVSSFIHLDTCFTPDYPYLRPYTVSKKQMVAWGQLASEQAKFRFLNLQLQHPYGPGDRKGKFVPWIIGQCLQGGVIDLTSGTQAKDFIFVSDVARAVAMLADEARSLPQEFQQFECGTGKCWTVRDFVESVHRLTESDAELRFGALPTRPNEIMQSEADISRLESLGWKPRVELEEGLRRTIQFEAEHQREGT